MAGRRGTHHPLDRLTDLRANSIFIPSFFRCAFDEGTGGRVAGALALSLDIHERLRIDLITTTSDFRGRLFRCHNDNNDEKNDQKISISHFIYR